ncbi:MAG: hypothetical protein SNJ68_05035 [Cyanobacteriota bacterium]
MVESNLVGLTGIPWQETPILGNDSGKQRYGAAVGRLQQGSLPDHNLARPTLTSGL